MDEEDAAELEEASPWSESLRERKKRLTRSLIANTATAMFLEQGFDDVKVADVAEVCGVSEKTVYNYFATKESLLFDREAEIAAEIWRVLGPGVARSPVDGMVDLLKVERDEMYVGWQSDSMALFRRFAELIDATPALQAALRDMSDRLERTAAEALAQQTGVSPDEPEPRIAAAALIALWRLQYDAVRRYALEQRSPDETRQLAGTEVERAARVVESGLWWFGAMTKGHPTRQQLKAAADAALVAGRQIVTAIRQARASFEQVHDEGASRTHEEAFPLQGLANLLEETARWKRDMLDQRDEWKRAYREEQTRLRQSQRELAHRYREAMQQRHQSARTARRDRGGPPWAG